MNKEGNQQAFPLITVIIPALNCPDILEACVQNLKASTFTNFEIIVVDDASTDNTPDVAARLGVKLVRLEQWGGPAKARNIGVESATGKYIFFIDADVVVRAETVGLVAETFEQNPDIDAMFGSYDKEPGALNFISQYKNLFHHYVHQQSRTQASTFWSGCGAIKKSVFIDIGGFDTSYGRPSIEDIELGVRLKNSGHNIVLNKDIQVTHLKMWTFWNMLKTDVFDRAIPWAKLIQREFSMPDDLNLMLSQKISAILAYGLLATIGLGAWHYHGLAILPFAALMGILLIDYWSENKPPAAIKVLCALTGAIAIATISFYFKIWALLVLAFLLGIVLVNFRFYIFFVRERHLTFAIWVLPLHVFYYIYSAAAFVIGSGLYHLENTPLFRKENKWRGGDRPTGINQPGEPILKRYLFLAGADLAAKGIGFVVAVALVRHFGSVGFGQISFASSIVMIGVLVAACGLDVYAVRNVARKPETLGAMAGAVIAIRLLLGAFVYSALLLLAAHVPSFNEIFWLIAFSGLLIFTGAVSLTWAPQALHQTNVLAAANFSVQLIYLLALLAVINTNMGLWAAPCALVLAETAVAVALLIWTCKIVQWRMRPFPLKKWFDIIKQSAPMGGSGLARTVAMGSDIIILGFFVPMEQLGWYVGAYKLYQLGNSLCAQYFVILLPRLSQKAADPSASLQAEVFQSLKNTLLVAAPLVTFAAITSDGILRSLFDPSFVTASVSLQVLLLALLFNLVSGHFRHTLLACGRQVQDFRLVAIGSIVHVVMKLALIPTLGIEGAAFGVLAGEISLTIMAVKAVRWNSQDDLQLANNLYDNASVPTAINAE